MRKGLTRVLEGSHKGPGKVSQGSRKGPGRVLESSRKALEGSCNGLRMIRKSLARVQSVFILFRSSRVVVVE